MSYFANFPTTRVQHFEPGGRSSRDVLNILTAVQWADVPVFPYQMYRIKDHDRPDGLASRVYGNARYAWLILFVNQRTLQDWPLNEVELYGYLTRRYGSVQAAHQTIVSYHRADGVVVNAETFQALGSGYTRSAYDHAFDTNEALREIRLVDPAHVGVLERTIHQRLSERRG